MKEYDIKITETIEKTVTVTAENLSEAQEKVRKSYSDSVYDFDPVTLVNTEFTVESEKTIDMDSLIKMDVLLVKPNMYPQPIRIGCELEDLQNAVGGEIEATYPFNEPVALLMDGNGKLSGKDLNRALRDEDGEMYDIVAGDFLIVGLGEEDFCSLSPDLMRQFEEHFHQPETFLRMGRGMMALPLPDDKVKQPDSPVKDMSLPHKNNHDRAAL